MADDQNPQLPLGPNDPTPPSPQDAASNAPPPAGSPPENPGFTGPGALHLIPINIEDEMRRSYLDYSMSVIIGRALPDVRDGLKPVHRRILFGMQEMGLQFNKKYTKSAKVVGHVMGNYHPHGDSAIYDTMVRLAQPFSLRYLLVDGQGNFGSIDGDPPAAMRYTESRMTRLAGEMLADLDSDTVDFAPNYDESTSEPTVLPVASSPTSSSTEAPASPSAWPPTSRPTTSPRSSPPPSPSSPATKPRPAPTSSSALEHVLGPDFPTGGYLYGRANIPQAYKTGRGRFLMRAKCSIENISGGRQAIIVTEIPYQVNKSKLIERIAELVNEGVITDIARDEFRDESDRDGMRIVIGLKRGSEHQIVLNQLYKHTQMQETFSMIFLAVHNGQPKELPLDQAIRAFLDHRVDVVRRRTAFLLAKARDREHILLGYQIALDNLDQVIRIIRQSSSRADARENLFQLLLRPHHLPPRHRAPRHHPRPREVRRRHQPPPARPRSHHRHPHPLLQADRRHPRTAALPPHPALHRRAPPRARRRSATTSPSSSPSSPPRKNSAASSSRSSKTSATSFGDPRRTQILDETTELTLEDLITDEQVAVTVSHTGYLKRTPISTYRQQRRGGTGRLGMKTRDEDFVAQLIINSTHAYLLCFTNTGRVYWLKVYEIPDISAAGKGKAMASLVALQPGEKVVTILPVRNLTDEGHNILFATRNGTVKKTPLKDFSNVMARGIIAINIDKDDELITARITDGNQVIFLATHDGMAIRFNEQDLRPMGRPATGNRGINLRKGDYVIGAAVTPSPEARERASAAKPPKNSASPPSSKTSSTKPASLPNPPSAVRPLRPQRRRIRFTADTPTFPPSRKAYHRPRRPGDPRLRRPPNPSTPPPRPSSTSSTKNSASPPASSSPSPKTASASAPTSTATDSSPAAEPASST